MVRVMVRVMVSFRVRVRTNVRTNATLSRAHFTIGLGLGSGLGLGLGTISVYMEGSTRMAIFSISSSDLICLQGILCRWDALSDRALIDTAWDNRLCCSVWFSGFSGADCQARKGMRRVMIRVRARRLRLK